MARTAPKEPVMQTTKARQQPERPVGRSGSDPGARESAGASGGLLATWPVPGLLFESAQTIRRRPDTADPLGGSEIDASLADVITRQRGQGSPLPADIAGPMGDALGVDLGMVRIHTGGEAANLSRSVQATAFTHGTDVYFGAGSYAPGTTSGLRLIAHEVAHTIQSDTGGGHAARPIIGRADDPAEADADRVADGVLQVLRRRTADSPADVTSAVQSPGGPKALLERLRVVRREPADFATATALTLKSGYGFLGFGSTPWDAILAAVRAYIALRNDQTDARARAIAAMPALIATWNQHHNVGTAVLNADEKAKVLALDQLSAQIRAEERELAADRDTQATMGPRFKGDYLLGRILAGRATAKQGDKGGSVARLQQALADLSHLASTGVTGTFDAPTTAAVKAFQLGRTLPDTGTVNQATMTAVQAAFSTHAVVRTLAQAPGVAAKSTPGEYKWSTAPAALSVGTRDVGAGDTAAAREAVKTSLVATGGGELPVFVSDLQGKGSYETRLKKRVLKLVDRQYDRLAKGKAARRKDTDLFPWTQLEKIAKVAKDATDAVFGKFAKGPPLAQNAGLHDAWVTKEKELKDPDTQKSSARWRVKKLLTGDAAVAKLDKAHGAIQSRDVEAAIVRRVQREIVTERWDKLLEIHKAWPAFADAGVVNLQRFKESTDGKNRTAMWDLFQTVVHEYLHTLEHSRHKVYRGMLDEQGGNKTLREGVVEYFTHTVLESVDYDAIRAEVEGDYHDVSVVHPIPQYHGYRERANAEKLAGIVGARNVIAAFFLGDVEKIAGKI